jgi:hypothetical protein
MKGAPRNVWVNGERYNVAYLFAPASGRVIRKAKLHRRVGRTAGMGQRCMGRFVAVHVTPEAAGLWLHIGRHRFPLDGATVASHTSQLGGTVSRLSVRRRGDRAITVRQLTLAKAVLSRFDPAYDDLDASMDDFLADIADIVASEERQSRFLEVSDPRAGPWVEALS